MRRWCMIIFGLALCLRVAGIIATHQYYNLERFELERIALSLSATGVFGNPYAIPTGPSAHVSPVYPIVLAAIFRVFGTGVPAEVIKQIFACAITALQCALMPVIARRFGFDSLTGLIAGFAAALLPLKFITETQGDWESNWAALVLMLAAAITVKLWTEREFANRQAIWSGLGWGLSLLVSWALAPLYAVVLAAGAFIAKRGSRNRYLVFSAISIGVAALCLSPWIIRNWFAFGTFIPGRTNSGIELRISNNDQASAREGDNFHHGVYHMYHPLQSVAEARKVLALGEVEYNRRLTQQAREWISAHPARFASLTAARFELFWFYPDREHLAKTVILWLRTLLAIAGLAIAWRANLISARVMALILFIVPLPNYLVHVALKHSYPIDWILTLLAAVAVGSAIEKFQGLRVYTLTGVRLGGTSKTAASV